ncbi:hypothetical protein D3C71_2169200 [compost metagenome]
MPAETASGQKSLIAPSSQQFFLLLQPCQFGESSLGEVAGAANEQAGGQFFHFHAASCTITVSATSLFLLLVSFV